MAGSAGIQDLVVGVAGLLAAGLLFREDRRVARWVEAEQSDGSESAAPSADHRVGDLARLEKYWRARWPVRALAAALLAYGIFLVASAIAGA